MSEPTGLDVNNLEQLRALVDDLRKAGVRAFKHPSGLELVFDRSGYSPSAPAPEAGEF